MTVSVVVPFAGDCEYRLRALAWVRPRYEALGWEVTIGQGNAAEWRKADAVADALTRATGDLLVVADGDVWSNDIVPAVQSVEQGTPWAVPFTRVYRFNWRGTTKIYDGEEPSAALPRAKPPYRGVMGGGCVVITRGLYAQIPLDRRFVGWGGEDDSWGWALRTLVGEPHRFGAHLWHLWHPSAAPPNRTYDNAANNALAGRYKDTRDAGDIDGMRALVEEARCQSNASSSTS